MAERINSIKSSLLAAVAIAVCLLAPLARAQIDPLPPVDKTSYTPEEQQQIATFVLKRVTAIGEGDASVRERARSELLAPLRRAGVSVAFRRSFRTAGLEPLTALADGQDPKVVINALFVLAEIGDDLTRLVVQSHTADESQDVRYAAVCAMKRTFQVVDSFAPAIDPGRVTEMVTHLTRRLEDETDAQVADAITMALLKAAGIRRDGFAAPARAAFIGVSSKVGSRLRRADSSDRPVTLLSSVRVAKELAGKLEAPGEVQPEVARAAAGFAGEVLAHLANLAHRGKLPNPLGWESDLTSLGERIIVFASLKLGKPTAAPGLPTMLEAGDYKAFNAATQQLVLSLGGKPFSLPDDAMQRIRDALEEE